MLGTELRPPEHGGPGPHDHGSALHGKLFAHTFPIQRQWHICNKYTWNHGRNEVLPSAHRGQLADGFDLRGRLGLGRDLRALHLRALLLLLLLLPEELEVRRCDGLPGQWDPCGWGCVGLGSVWVQPSALPELMEASSGSHSKAAQPQKPNLCLPWDT